MIKCLFVKLDSVKLAPLVVAVTLNACFLRHGVKRRFSRHAGLDFFMAIQTLGIGHTFAGIVALSATRAL